MTTENEKQEMTLATVASSQTPQVRPAGLAPSTMNEAWRFAQIVASSRMYGVTTPEQAFMIVTLADALGIHPARAFTSIHIISGKPTMSADLQIALIKERRNLCKYFVCTESTDQQATWETHREGDPAPSRLTFTMQDAERAELLKNAMWKKYPAQMLKKRAAAFLARDVYPDVLAGIYEPEEMQSIQPVTANVVTVEPVADDTDLLARLEACEDADTLASLKQELTSLAPKGARRDVLGKAFKAATARVESVKAVA